MKKKTTVEWLEEEITNRITRRNPHDSIIIQTQGETLIELFEQANEIFKQQIINANDRGWGVGRSGINETAEQYYRETFKNEEL